MLPIMQSYRIGGINNKDEEDLLCRYIQELYGAHIMAMDHFQDVIAPKFASSFPTKKPDCAEKERIASLEKQVALQEIKVYSQ